ncbi:MAG: DUF192 domain-containing protein [Candidatus Cloacimonas sp.]|jgi:uncharacterized membrane protein (UPF0127 family)|nr:DUF192 domain-containing protein [Candidatus Cloacimonas sp.]
MNRYLVSIVLLIALSLVYGCKQEAPAPVAEKPKYEFRHDGSLDIISKDGKIKCSFRIEIVEREDEVMRGLKYRESIEPDQGMLFVFGKADLYDFWMQDTYIPLDMLFIDVEETIFQIHENAQPFSEERISPTQANNFVLELNAGTAKKMNIQTGDKISWKRLQ